MDDNLHEKAMEAATIFLYKKGYDVLAKNYELAGITADIIAKDNESNAIVFVQVNQVNMEATGFPNEPEFDRRRWENMAIAWLDINDYQDCEVRFDVISLVVMSYQSSLS